MQKELLDDLREESFELNFAHVAGVTSGKGTSHYIDGISDLPVEN